MDEVITCYCGCQSWIIGTSGTRCSARHHWLIGNVVSADVSSINKSLEQIRVGYEKTQGTKQPQPQVGLTPNGRKENRNENSERNKNTDCSLEKS